MKMTEDRPYAKPEAAATRLLQIARQTEPVMKGRIYIELLNGPFLYRDKGSVDEFRAGMKLLIDRKDLIIHESGTFVWLPDGEPPEFNVLEKQAKLI